MAITVSTTSTATREGNTVRINPIANRIPFTFTAGASETAVEIELRESDGTTPIVRLKPRVFVGGSVVVDVNQLLRDEVGFSEDRLNSRLLSNNITAETESMQDYTVYWREAGTTGAFSTDSNTYTVLGGGFSIQQSKEYGANYAGFAVVDGGKGKWLTRLAKKRLFYIEDRSGNISVFYDAIRFITDDSFSSASVGVIITYAFPSGSPTAVDSPNVAISAGVYSTALPNAETRIGLGANRVLIETFNKTPEPNVSIIDEIEYIPYKVCRNVHAIRWINSLGFYEVWAFEGDSGESQELDEIGQYRTNPADLSTASGNRFSLGFEGYKIISLRDETLSTEEAKWFRGLFSSPRVQFFVGELEAGTALADWVDVTVEGGGVDLNTRNTKHSVSVEIGLPNEYYLRS